MTRLAVITESLPTRCEICHQSDCFDALTNQCQRCSSMMLERASNAQMMAQLRENQPFRFLTLFQGERDNQQSRQVLVLRLSLFSTIMTIFYGLVLLLFLLPDTVSVWFLESDTFGLLCQIFIIPVAQLLFHNLLRCQEGIFGALFLTALTLLVFFGGASVMLWGYRHRTRTA